MLQKIAVQAVTFMRPTPGGLLGRAVARLKELIGSNHFLAKNLARTGETQFGPVVLCVHDADYNWTVTGVDYDLLVVCSS